MRIEIHDLILVITSLFGLVGTLLGAGGLYQYFKLRAEIRAANAQSEENEANAAKTIGEAWSALVTPLNDRINDLQKQLNEKDKLVEKLQKELDELRKELAEYQSGKKKKVTGPLVQ